MRATKRVSVLDLILINASSFLLILIVFRFGMIAVFLALGASGLMGSYFLKWNYGYPDETSEDSATSSKLPTLQVVLPSPADPLPPETIQKYYASLSKDQKEQAEATEEYENVDKAVAIAALKRRLDFVRSQEQQVYQADRFVLRTERAGPRLKITWDLQPTTEAYHLLGFRKTEAFFLDPWSDTDNGPLIIDAQKSGDTTESLEEGKTYFYTLFMRRWHDGMRCSPLRFQITLFKDETDSIEALIRRIEGEWEQTQKVEKIDPDKETLSRALKEVSSAVEIDTAFDAMLKSFRDQIQKSHASEQEKKEKLGRINDIVSKIREKYEPSY